SGCRVLINQYGVGSAGSSRTTWTVPGTQGRCITNASGSAAGPSSSRRPAASSGITSAMYRTGSRASSTTSSSPTTATRIRPSHHSPAAAASANTTNAPAHPRGPSTPTPNGAASPAVTASVASHHRHGTVRRSSCVVVTIVRVVCTPEKLQEGRQLAKVRVALRRLVPDLPLPSYAHPGDAGADLMAAREVELAPGERALVPTGVAIALPPGYVGLVHPRSGLAARLGVTVLNAPGTVDAGYRGEIMVILVNHDRTNSVKIARGDRI